MIKSFHLSESGQVRTDLTPEDIAEALKGQGILWVDFFRATREESALLSDVFHFHPLAVDDCLRPTFRPRVDVFDDHLFIVVHGPDLATRDRELRTLELDAFLGRNFVVTFHGTALRSIVQFTEQCEKAPQRTMGRGADFLLYSILDQMAENYTPILNRAEAQAARIEESVLAGKAGGEILPELVRLRRSLLNLRRVITAQRDAANLLTHQGPPLVSDRAKVYFRDVVDRYQRVLEITEIQREVLGGARDTYLTMNSNRATEIMKTLTIIATIMMPLMAVSSHYGMNFRYMPELGWKYGYLWALGLMACIAGGMLYYFRRKKWL